MSGWTWTQMRKPTCGLAINELAARAYDAYCATRDWKSYNGEPLPRWQQVRHDIQLGWLAAAKAIVERMTIEDPSPPSPPSRDPA